MSEFKKNDTAVVKTCCAVFFLLFTFLYVYDYQDDILAATQHVLSRGATHYNRIIGAILFTVFLWLIHEATFIITKLRRCAYALTYFPAFLVLGILTDVTPNLEHESYLGNWLWGFPLLMVIYAFVVYICRQLESIEQNESNTGLFSRLNWGNLLVMILSSIMTCCIGCSDEVFHWRMQMESDIMKGHYAQSLTVGANEEETDSSLTMLRVWSLSKTHELGNKLFDYPVEGGSAALLPNGKSVCLIMAPADTLYHYLGIKFKQQMPAMTYLEKIHEKGYASKDAHDWLLCAYLLDGRLDQFVKTLPKYYKLNESLPLHYREALTLYTHLKEHPVLVFHSSLMDADYNDFNDLARKYSDPRERNSMLRDSYGNTYWYYYFQILKGKPRH